jgi:hypothetical protein
MDIVPGLVGATMGGVFGYFIYKWGLQQGLKAGVVPGALVGLGSGLVSSRPSRIRGVICGLAALALGIFAEWRNAPFVADNSLGYFLSHMQQLPPLVLIMIALGGLLGWRWGGDSLKPSFASKPAPPEDLS